MLAARAHRHLATWHSRRETVGRRQRLRSQPRRPDFAERVVDTLERVGVPADRLIIEITETALLTDPIRAAIVLAQLAASGVKISLDDFGSGHTSLRYLSTLPMHQLKIDKSFVTDMPDNKSHDAIVRSIIDLGHNLGLRVVAEGVETNGALLRLRAAGCDVAQGYLLARPMPLEQLSAWLLAIPVEGPVPGMTAVETMGIEPTTSTLQR